MMGVGDSKGGQIWLAVRPPDDQAVDGTPHPEYIDKILTDGLPQADLAKIKDHFGIDPNSKYDPNKNAATPPAGG